MTTEHSHHPHAIAARLERGPDRSYLEDFVYGAIDGTVTTFAVVSGVAGAGLAPNIVIILGLANLVGDGFSMAASNYLGTRASTELRKKARRMEERHIELYPEGEREEVRQIYSRKGFRGADLERAVDIVTSDTERWVETMMTDELGLSLRGPSPIGSALSTFFAFMFVGFLPLFSFVFQAWVPDGSAFTISAWLTAASLFSIGAVKSRFVDQGLLLSGLETLAIGGVAAGLAWGAGRLLEPLV